MDTTYLMSQEHYDLLQKELDELRSVKLPEIVERIAIARGQGDLSENAEYQFARDEQARINGKIMEIEEQLKYAKIINTESVDSHIVNVGMKVKVYDYETKTEIEYEIEGAAEANLKKNIISNESPVGKALLERQVGDDVVVKTPDTSKNYKLKILEIKKK